MCLHIYFSISRIRSLRHWPHRPWSTLYSCHTILSFVAARLCFYRLRMETVTSVLRNQNVKARSTSRSLEEQSRSKCRVWQVPKSIVVACIIASGVNTMSLQRHWVVGNYDDTYVSQNHRLSSSIQFFRSINFSLQQKYLDTSNLRVK